MWYSERSPEIENVVFRAKLGKRQPSYARHTTYHISHATRHMPHFPIPPERGPRFNAGVLGCGLRLDQCLLIKVYRSATVCWDSKMTCEPCTSETFCFLFEA